MIKNLIKKKKGNILIMGLILILMALFLITFIVDFGKVYIYRVQAQNITDAAALAGAGEGKHGFTSMVRAGEKRAEVLPGPAKSAANKVISANRKHLPPTVSYNNVRYNQRDKRGWDSLAQYLNGDFTVDSNSSVKTTFLNNGLNKVNIPFLKFKSHAKVHVSPR